MARNVADDDPQLARRKREHVVPVAADCFAFGGHVAGREFESGETRQLFGEQAAFQQRGGGAFDREVSALDRARDAFGDDLEQRDVVIGEGSVLQPPDVEHAEKPVGGEERDTEHHLDALFPEDRVRDRRGVDTIEANRASACRDPSLRSRYRSGCEHLRVPPPRSRGLRWRRVHRPLGEQQDRRGVRVERFLHPAQQLVEQVIDVKPVIAVSVSAWRLASCS